MLIDRFFVPENEASDQGLFKIDMPRLGRFVALAGKNGSGKSRILSKLEFYVNVRTQQSSQLDANRSQIANYSSAIVNEPNSPHVGSWVSTRDSMQHQIELATQRIYSQSGSFKTINFVPKNLQLQDPRQFARGELVARYSQAMSPGVHGFETRCLFYIEQTQHRHWNATHPHFAGSVEERTTAIADYDRMQALVRQLLDVEFGRNIDGVTTLFGKPIPEAGLSDGQKVILQLCVALHAQRSSLDNSVFLLDEPENHLHPASAVQLLRQLYEVGGNSQIWVATHSVPLLAFIASVEPMSLWFVENGRVSNAGRHPISVLQSLLGSAEEIGQLHAFTGLPAQLAAVNYATESLLAPQVVTAAAGDPQIGQIHSALQQVREGERLRVLDFGAGKGRLLEGLAVKSEEDRFSLIDNVDYVAFDLPSSDRQRCEQVIGSIYGSSNGRYYSSIDDYFSHRDEGSLDIVVMCNVLHEIPPNNWPTIFSPLSLIGRALADKGFLLLVEDQRIPVGELAHEYGFLVLDTSHLRTLFGVSVQDNEAGRFRCDDARGDGRLKAHWIAKSLLGNISATAVRSAIGQLAETAKSQVRRLRTEEPSYGNGQLHGFWTQQLANAALFLEGA